MNIRRSEERGRTELGWLHSKHSFSFGDYYNPNNMGYRSLRVINDDIVEGGQGFGTHGHRDMEIISLVLRGGLAHRDSMGHEETLRPGEVQVMSAGTGIKHSEFNPSPTENAHFMQIWITPEKVGITPAYGQRDFPVAERTNRFQRVAGPQRHEADSALTINQDADVLLSRVESGHEVRHVVATGRGAYLHLIEGGVTVNGNALRTGDAITIEGPAEIVVNAVEGVSEVLLFDLT